MPESERPKGWLVDRVRYMILAKPHSARELIALLPDAGFSSVRTVVSRLHDHGEITRENPAVQMGARWVATPRLRQWAMNKLAPLDATSIPRAPTRGRKYPELTIKQNGKTITLLSQHAAARHFGVSLTTILFLVKRGRLKTRIIQVPTVFVEKDQPYRPDPWRVALGHKARRAMKSAMKSA